VEECRGEKGGLEECEGCGEVCGEGIGGEGIWRMRGMGVGFLMQILGVFFVDCGC
jgi:hypothetical protein